MVCLWHTNHAATFFVVELSLRLQLWMWLLDRSLNSLWWLAIRLVLVQLPVVCAPVRERRSI
ncbi:hypothetical protein BDV28DRAFT_139578 [Aspergillus coremiiformis]|uniref:Uncharacterized protein n=1 Tax=Aspergillus coremiiformis TaxID=138285 RepID=A0A5N6Z2G6_9EURO|nr:hypothetical protein BDV28DRAFT_139578 [Aspergillus coremiiformis]